jgi:hypothetical protein
MEGFMQVLHIALLVSSEVIAVLAGLTMIAAIYLALRGRAGETERLDDIAAESLPSIRPA